MNNKEISRRQMFEVMGRTAAGVIIAGIGAGALSQLEAEAAIAAGFERPTGVPSEVVKDPKFGIVESTGNAWKTLGSTKVITNFANPLTLDEGIPYQMGDPKTPGLIGELTVLVPADWMVWSSGGRMDVRVDGCDMNWNGDEVDDSFERKMWLFNKDCACPDSKTKFVYSNVRHGHNRFMVWPISHRGLKSVRESQMGQYSDSARQIGITTLEARFWTKDSGQYLIYSNKPQEGHTFTYVDGNGK